MFFLPSRRDQGELERLFLAHLSEADLPPHAVGGHDHALAAGSGNRTDGHERAGDLFKVFAGTRLDH